MGKESLPNSDMVQSSDDFAAAYELHARGIYQFLYWRTRDNALAEDLTSSIFEKAWRGRRSFHGGSVQAWLYRIARNTLTDHWRKKQAVSVDEIESLSEAVTEDTMALQIDREFEAQRLQRAVARLPKTMRLVVQLRFINNLPVRQVAERLDLTENNVRIIQYRALKKLKAYLT